MEDVCARGWVVISKDKRLLERANALMIWKKRKGRIFVIASGDADGEQLAYAVLTALRKMEQIIENASGPFAVRILVSGSVEMIRPEDLPADFLV